MSAGYGFRQPDERPQGYDLEQTLALLKEMRTVLDTEDLVDPGIKILMTDVDGPWYAFYGENVTDQVGSLSQMPMRDTFLPDAITADNVIFWNYFN